MACSTCFEFIFYYVFCFFCSAREIKLASSQFWTNVLYRTVSSLSTGRSQNGAFACLPLPVSLCSCFEENRFLTEAECSSSHVNY